MPLRRGSRLGKYRLDRRIGRGAVGAVWKARDTIEGRVVALKVVPPDAVQEFGREGVEREARIGIRLEHPNIVTPRNADWIDGHFVLATDLARSNLAAYPGARRSGRIALRVIRDVAAGLAHAHARRIMHRDLKPGNILIFADGRAALADFGEWRLVKTVAASYTEGGTLGYMAPEQAYGRPSLGSDVFSLGLVAYELLSGHLLKWPLDWPPEGYSRFSSKVPAPVERALRKAAEFEPARRFSDAVEFQRALESAFRRAEQQRSRPRRRSRRPTPVPTALEVEAELFRRRHGRRLEMRFACHRCDGPISEAMVWCPWCGSKENSFREITPYPLVCPDCERGVRAEWTACPWCASGRLAGNGRRPRPDSAALRRCARRDCDGELRAFMRYCPRCKQRPRRPWVDRELEDRCPRCHWSVSRQSWRHCPWCGRREPAAGKFSRS